LIGTVLEFWWGLVGIIPRVLGETPTFTQSPQNPSHNPLGRGRVLGIDKNTLKFGEKWGLAVIKLVQYSSTKHIFKSEWGFGVW
jgi:hypothetical protein